MSEPLLDVKGEIRYWIADRGDEVWLGRYR